MLPNILYYLLHGKLKKKKKALTTSFTCETWGRKAGIVGGNDTDVEQTQSCNAAACDLKQRGEGRQSDIGTKLCLFVFVRMGGILS